MPQFDKESLNESNCIKSETLNKKSLDYVTKDDRCETKLNLVLQKLNSVETQMKQYFTKSTDIPIINTNPAIPIVTESPVIPSVEINADKNNNEFIGDQAALFEEMMLECKSIEDLKVNLPEFQFHIKNLSPHYFHYSLGIRNWCTMQ